MDEIIKPIPGYEQYYSVSNYGRVFSHNYRKTGKFHELAQSYLYDKRRSSTSMYKRAKMWHINKNTPTAIHRLVAITFIPNPYGLPQVNHIDGNKSNNRSNNLEWCSVSTNNKHAAITGLHVYAFGEDHSNAILTEDQARYIKEQVKNPYIGQLDDLASQFCVSKHCIFDIKRGKTWAHL